MLAGALNTYLLKRPVVRGDSSKTLSLAFEKLFRSALILVLVLNGVRPVFAVDPILGEPLFQEHCASCHGGGGVTLGASVERLRSIAAGRHPHGGGTPPFVDFGPAELEQLAAFLSDRGFQDFTIIGRVSDGLGEPVPDVTVTLQSPYLDYAPRSVLTDGDGVFIIDALPAGDHWVELSAPGMRFSPARERVILDGGLDAGSGLEYLMYRPGEPEPSPPRMVQRVSPAGDDFNDGRSWAAPKLTLGEALRQLPEGGEVWIAEGTYYEPVFLRGRSLYGGFAGNELSRDQRDPMLHPTIFDGTPALVEEHGFFPDSIIVVEGLDFNVSTIDGITVQNAQAFNGGGIDLAFHALGLIRHCQIVNNSALESGGAIYCSSTGEGSIFQNLIRGNVAAYGGAIAVQPGGKLDVLADNLIDGNRAPWVGGVACDGAIQLAANNTFVRNESDSGGTLSYLQGVGTNWNNIIAFNTSGVEDDSGSSEWRHNAVYANGTADWLGVGPGEGDVVVAPGFVDISIDDFHLLPSSPCVDAGEEIPVIAGETDLDGHARLQRRGVDLGAFELAAPRLSLRTQEKGLRLSWPGEEVGMVLEENRGLKLSGWSPVAGVQLENGEYTVVRSPDLTRRFYRLRGR